MAYKSIYKNIIFIEGHEDYVKNLGTIEYKKGGFFNNQLKNLDNVKEQLAYKAKQLGGNAVVNFKYGQKNKSWFRSLLLSIDDDINWYGYGEVVVLDYNKYKELFEKLTDG